MARDDHGNELIQCPPGVVNREEGLSGCGSYNVSAPDENDCVECRDCGLYFPIAATVDGDLIDDFDGPLGADPLARLSYGTQWDTGSIG